MRIALRRGLNVPLSGRPEQKVDNTVAVARVGLLGHDLGGIRTELLVESSQQVSVGTPLFRARNTPRLVFCSPVSGEVERVEFGARRRLSEVSILSDGKDRRLDFDTATAYTPTGLRELLLACGQWPALRARPFDRIADPDGKTQAIFVTAVDTATHAPDPCAIINERRKEFSRGLSALALLTEGPIFLCQADGPALGEDSKQLQVVRFSGPHPAGLVGTHIAYLYRPGAGQEVWHVGYQDVIAIGHLLATGMIDPFRVIALSGPGLRNPRLAKVPLGADLHALVRADLTRGNKAILSGPLISGRESSFLGRYDRQATIIERHRPARSHWLVEALRKAQKTAPFIPTQALEQSLGSNAPVVPLLRALSITDVEAAERLGCAWLAEEDMALATYLSGGQTDFGQRLRTVLDRLEKGE